VLRFYESAVLIGHRGRVGGVGGEGAEVRATWDTELPEAVAPREARGQERRRRGPEAVPCGGGGQHGMLRWGKRVTRNLWEVMRCDEMLTKLDEFLDDAANGRKAKHRSRQAVFFANRLP